MQEAINSTPPPSQTREHLQKMQKARQLPPFPRNENFQTPQEMQKARQLACPLCCKSFQNMRDIWNIMDEEAQSNPMPSEYANWMVRLPDPSL